MDQIHHLQCYAWTLSELDDVTCCSENPKKHLPYECEVIDNGIVSSYAKGVYNYYDVQQIEGIKQPDWLANVVMVPKKDKSWRLCVDFKDVNKACPKDPFPLPRFNQIIDATAGHDSLCFLDAYSGYQQVKMKESDQAATTFITPYGPLCFNTMPFELKNAGATYQRMIQTCLEKQIGKTVEAYMDDVVIKTRDVG